MSGTRQKILHQFTVIVRASDARACSTAAPAAALAASKSRARRAFTELPGPLALPMLKHSAHVLPRIGNFHHSVGLGLLDGLQRRYGDLVRLARGGRARPVLYVFEPRLIHQVYESGATESPRWKNSPLAVHRQSVGSTCPLHGDNVDIWTSLRKLFLDPSFLANFNEALENIACDATRRLSELRHSENALNIEFETEMYRWALEALGVVVLGIRLGCLEGTPQVHTSRESSHKTSLDDDSPDKCSLSKKPLEECTPAERLIKQVLRIARCGMMVRSEETLVTQAKTFTGALSTFGGHLELVEYLMKIAVDTIDKDKRPESCLLQQLRPLGAQLPTLIADIFLAGVDPLAHTALAMLYHVSLHPATQQRAQDELAWLTVSDSTDRDHSSDTSQEQRTEHFVKHAMDLPYIAACVREALRLHPSTGGVVRRSKVSFSLDGYEIPSGVDIVLAHGVASKSEAEWGRARTFIPDRWCPEGWEPLRASRAHPTACKPFGETCPASTLVPKVLASLTAKILEKHRLEWHGPSPNMVTDGVNRLQPPYYFVLRNAS